MDIPFETLSMRNSELETFLSGFDRPGHIPLIVGGWFRSEFDEFVDVFMDPHELILKARSFDLADWVARTNSTDQSFGGLFEAMMGPLAANPRDGASDAEKHIHTARQSIENEEEPPEFIKELQGALNDASRLTDVKEGDPDPMPDIMNLMSRLQNAGRKAETFEDNLRSIHTIMGFMQNHRGADEGFDAVFGATVTDPDETSRPFEGLFKSLQPTEETTVAVLPVDDAWAALAYMQQGNYAHDMVPLLALARDLAKRFDARPIMATGDTIVFQIGKPAKTQPDDVADAFQALGGEIEPHPLVAAKEWHVWWD